MIGFIFAAYIYDQLFEQIRNCVLEHARGDDRYYMKREPDNIFDDAKDYVPGGVADSKARGAGKHFLDSLNRFHKDDDIHRVIYLTSRKFLF